jgi:predicted nucleic acid-binding protein
MWYNTISLEGLELSKAHLNTLKQEEFITEIFKNNPQSLIIPSQVLKVYIKIYNKNTPITSIRRAITDLTAKGILRKTSVTAMGEYGKVEHCWVLKETTSVKLEFEFDNPDDIPESVG